jgi:hypothetical protein
MVEHFRDFYLPLVYDKFHISKTIAIFPCQKSFFPFKNTDCAIYELFRFGEYLGRPVAIG